MTPFEGVFVFSLRALPPTADCEALVEEVPTGLEALVGFTTGAGLVDGPTGLLGLASLEAETDLDGFASEVLD